MMFLIILAMFLTGVIHLNPAQAYYNYNYRYIPLNLRGIDYRVHNLVRQIASGQIPIVRSAENWLLELGNDNLTEYFTSPGPKGNITDPMFPDPKCLSSVFANRQLLVQRALQLLKQRLMSGSSAHLLIHSNYGYYYSNRGRPDIGFRPTERTIREALKAFPQNVVNGTVNVGISPFAIQNNYTLPNVFCLVAPNRCNYTERYRSFDGSCNNHQVPYLGRAFRPYRRYLPPDYADDVSEPRRSTHNDPLKNARKISMEISEGRQDLDPVHTALFMTFGQFLDHDIGLAPPQDLLKNISGTLQSVSANCDKNCSTDNPHCLPISISSNDPDFPNTECFHFTRTMSSMPERCVAGPREQLNEVTAFLDLSQIYGSTKEENMKLRNTTHPHLGLLKTEPHPLGFKDLLPQGNDSSCKNMSDEVFCFRSGDVRVNENALLSALHTVYHRYHNFLATGLRKVNPHWSGEKLFQEARKILIGIWQHQIYNEYVPQVIGPKWLESYKIKLQETTGYYGYGYHNYNGQENPEISNAFSAAAFRMGHSAIPDTVKTINSDNGIEREHAFSETFHNPGLLFAQYQSGESPVDAILRGMFREPMEKINRQFTTQITKHLFTDNPPHGLGVDLVALNIQRGRDHGIPGYNAWRKGCDLSVAKHFRDLTDIWKPQRKKLEKLYKSVDDIDLFVGGISERPVDGGVVGPTFACIIGQQFRSLLVGDRFFYKSSYLFGGQEKVNEVEKSLISRMLCDVGDNVTHIQKYALLQPIKKAFKSLGRSGVKQNLFGVASRYKGEKNKVEDCSSLPSINLELWKD